MFETMLHVDTLRGEDSTGVFLIDTTGNVQIAKAAVTGCEFLKSKEWSKMRTEAIRHGWVLVGHNRKATHGSITDANAHPFWVEDKVVLVHNGSFFGSHKHLADTEVDSHAIAHVLANNPDDTQAALQKVNAAYALMWYDVPSKRFNIIRNNQRPLHHASNDNAWMFTSEQEILEFCYKRVYNKKVEPLSQPIHTHSTWTLQADKSAEMLHTDLDCSFRSTSATQTAWTDEDSMCAYGTWGHRPQTQTQTPLVLGPLSDTFKAFISRRATTLYDWQHKLAYGRFKALREGILQDDCRIRVVVSDFDLNLDNQGADALLIGEWVNHDASVCLPVVFSISNEQLTEEMNTEGESVYYVSVKNHFWNPSGDTDKDQENIRGYPYLWATNPTKLVVNSHVVH